MPMDLSHIIQAAAEAALRDQGSPQQAKNKSNDKKRKGLTAPRALLLGAGMFTVGRLVVGSRGRHVLEDLQERLAIYESEHFGPDGQEGDEALEEDDEFEEEPEDYEDEEPEGEYDQDEEPEGEDDEDEEPDEERPRRRTSSAGSRNGRH